MLPSYTVANQGFSGLIISNSGRSPVTDMELIVDFTSALVQMETDGPHEPYEIISGGEPGDSDLHLRMNRMSAGTELTIYFLTNRTNYIYPPLLTSNEVKGRLGFLAAVESLFTLESIVILSFLFGVLATFLVIALTVFWPRK